VLSIAHLDRPFQGWAHVDRYPFERARDDMNEAR
jgi:hypothetical protein